MGKRSLLRCVFFSLILFSHQGSLLLAQPAHDLKTTRILFLIDGSSSMLDTWTPGTDRFTAAKTLVGGIMDSIVRVNQNVEYAIRVFGHQHGVKANNCYDSRVEVPFARMNNVQIKTRLQFIHPQGVSPIAWSLKETAEVDFTSGARYAYSLILITDGGESCGGNICDVMTNIVNKKINFKPYIISLNDYEPLRKEYECVGKYMVVQKEEDFIPVIRTILEDNRNFVADRNTFYIPDRIAAQPDIKKPVVADTTPRIVKADTPKVIKNDPVIRTERDNPPGSAAPNPSVPPIALLPYKGMPKPKLNYIRSRDNIPLKSIPRLPKIQIPGEDAPPAIVKADTPKRNEPAPPVKKEEPARVNMSKLPLKGINTKWRMNALFTIPTPDKIRIARLPKIDIPREPVTLKISKPDVSNPTTNVSSEETGNPDQPGTMQLYFTDGKGKYYRAQPEIEIIRSDNKKTEWKGSRAVNTDGSPKPITLPDGNYIARSVKSGREAPFTIEKGSNKKVEMVVGFGSLSFVYKGTNEVPQGFVASVNKRFEDGPRVEQPTDVVLTYESSNYHIEINTLPATLLNVDLEFDINTVVSIPKAGTVQVMNEDEIGRVEFWYQLGDRYIRFYEMNVLGDVEWQKENFKPGPYQARYKGKNASGEIEVKAKTFQIQSGQTTQILLD